MIFFHPLYTYLKLQRRSTLIIPNSLATCRNMVRLVALDELSSTKDCLQGVLVHPTDPRGLTWEQYNQGIETWRVDQGHKPVTLPPSNKKVLKIAHFNDVYQIFNQKVEVLI